MSAPDWNEVECTVLDVVVDDVVSCANVEVWSVLPTEEDGRECVLVREGVVNGGFGETEPGPDPRVIPLPCPGRVKHRPRTQHVPGQTLLCTLPSHENPRACPRLSSCCLGCNGAGVGVATKAPEKHETKAIAAFYEELTYQRYQQRVQRSRLVFPRPESATRDHA